jgi:hypothetical protein
MLPGDVEYIRADLAAEKDAEIERLREVNDVLFKYVEKFAREYEPESVEKLMEGIREAKEFAATEADKAGGE